MSNAATVLDEFDDPIDQVFGAGGHLARARPGYEPREGQIQIARDVLATIDDEGVLLAEGGTGVGKSFAYLVPAIARAVRENRPVVVATATIALQEQLIEKDLPALAAALPWPFTFSILKGRNNYVCAHRYHEHGPRRAEFESTLNEEGRRRLRVVEQWAGDVVRAGPDAERGDVSDLPFVPPPTIWRRFSVSADECKGRRCQHIDRCFPNRAKDRAARSTVIVTNFHLLLAHLQIAAETGNGILPESAIALVLDEAHELPEIARRYFGDRVSCRSIEWTAREVRGPRHERTVDASRAADALEEAGRRFFAILSAIQASRERRRPRVAIGQLAPSEVTALRALEGALGEAVARFDGAIVRLGGNPARNVHAFADPDEVTDSDELRRLMKARSGAMNQLRAFRRAFAEPGTVHEDRTIAWSLDRERTDDGADKDDVALLGQLVRPGDLLRGILFETMELAETAVVCTSATLATGGNDFAYFAKEAGVPARFASRAVESPFDWPNQALFVVPDEIPDPGTNGYTEAVATALQRIVVLAGGRTLGLFTSWAALKRAADAVAGVCRENKIRLLQQGDLPRAKLVEAFRADVRSVLLGTSSLWTGVDVSGEACSVVVIDRLPFPSPEDPVLDALGEADRDVFFNHSVPRAITAFRQGFGRLIRSRSDRGVVVCLDRRLQTKRYGRRFLLALPDVPKSMRLESIPAWLSNR